MPTFFKDKTTDGPGTEIDWSGNHWGSVQFVGVWDGATVTVEGSLNDGDDYTEPTLYTFTEDVLTDFGMGTGKVKATISGAGALTSLSGYISPG